MVGSSGLDQVFSTATGKISERQEVVLLARTHRQSPETYWFFSPEKDTPRPEW
ncbi:MAG: hypothetical protein R6V85_08790 [Polyangia bacterium]